MGNNTTILCWPRMIQRGRESWAESGLAGETATVAWSGCRTAWLEYLGRMLLDVAVLAGSRTGLPDSPSNECVTI